MTAALGARALTRGSLGRSNEEMTVRSCSPVEAMASRTAGDGLLALELKLNDDLCPLPERVEHLGECWDPRVPVSFASPDAGIEFLDLRERFLQNRSSPVRGAVDGCIVHDDQVVVRRDLEVEFEPVDAQFECLFECQKRVFGVFGGKPAVGDVQNHGFFTSLGLASGTMDMPERVKYREIAKGPKGQADDRR